MPLAGFVFSPRGRFTIDPSPGYAPRLSPPTPRHPNQPTADPEDDPEGRILSRSRGMNQISPGPFLVSKTGLILVSAEGNEYAMRAEARSSINKLRSLLE